MPAEGLCLLPTDHRMVMGHRWSAIRACAASGRIWGGRTGKLQDALLFCVLLWSEFNLSHRSISLFYAGSWNDIGLSSTCLKTFLLHPQVWTEPERLWVKKNATKPRGHLWCSMFKLSPSVGWSVSSSRWIYNNKYAQICSFLKLTESPRKVSSPIQLSEVPDFLFRDGAVESISLEAQLFECQ